MYIYNCNNYQICIWKKEEVKDWDYLVLVFFLFARITWCLMKGVDYMENLKFKNLKLNYDGFENYLWKQMKHWSGGVQYIFRFGNSYGASIVKGYGTYGYEEDLWELAVLRFRSESEDERFIVYDTPITDDVIGWLNDKEVRDLLKRIQELNTWDVLNQHSENIQEAQCL